MLLVAEGRWDLVVGVQLVGPEDQNPLLRNHMPELVEQVTSLVDPPPLRVLQYELSLLVKAVADNDEVPVRVYLKLACDLTDLKLRKSPESCRREPLPLLGVLEAFEHVQDVAHHVLTHFLSGFVEFVRLVHFLLPQLLGRVLGAVDFGEEAGVRWEKVVDSKELKHVCLDCPFHQSGVLVLEHEQRLAVVVAVVVLVSHAVGLRQLAHSQVEVRVLEHLLRSGATRLGDEVKAPVELFVTRIRLLFGLEQLLHRIFFVPIVPDFSETDAPPPLVLQGLLIVKLLDFHQSSLLGLTFACILDVHAFDQTLQEHGLLGLSLAEGMVFRYACHHLELARDLTRLNLCVLLRHHFWANFEELYAHQDQQESFQNYHF